MANQRIWGPRLWLCFDVLGPPSHESFPAASSGVSIGNHLNRPKGRGIKPLSASGGLVRLWRIDVNTIYVFDMPLSPFNALDEGGLSGGF